MFPFHSLNSTRSTTKHQHRRAITSNRNDRFIVVEAPKHSQNVSEPDIPDALSVVWAFRTSFHSVPHSFCRGSGLDNPASSL
jgi:hypothetical protein